MGKSKINFGLICLVMSLSLILLTSIRLIGNFNNFKIISILLIIVGDLFGILSISYERKNEIRMIITIIGLFIINAIALFLILYNQIIGNFTLG